MADLQIVLSGDEARAVRAIQKLVDKERELARAAADTGVATRRSAEDAAFSLDKLGNKIGDGVRNMASWDTAVDVLRTGYEAVAQVVDRIVQRQKEAAAFVGSSAGGLEALGQLAGGSGGAMRDLSAHVRRVYPIIGGADMNAAAKLVNDVVAAGFDDSATIDAAARLYHTLGGEAGKAATGIAGIQKSMGIDETGDFNLVMAKAVEAAKTAPGGVPEVLKYASKAGGIARTVGMRDEELFSAFAAVAAAAGNPEAAGSQLPALITQMAKHGGTGSLMDWVDQVGGRGMSNPDLIKFLGSDEAFRAFSALRLGGGDVRAGTSRMAGVTPIDLAAAGDADPTVRAERLFRQAQAREALSAERQGQVRRVADAIRLADQAEARETGFPEGVVQAGAWAQEFERDSPYMSSLLRLPGKIATFPYSLFMQDAPTAEQRAEERLGSDPQMDQQTRVLEKVAERLVEVEFNTRGVQGVQAPGSGGRDSR